MSARNELLGVRTRRWRSVNGGHRARAFDTDPLVYEDRRRPKIADDASWHVKLDRRAGADVAGHGAASDDDCIDVDFGRDLGTFADDQHIVALDVPAEVAIDP